MKTKNTVVLLASCLIFAGGAVRTEAVTMFVASSAALGANDSVDWITAGPNGANLGSSFNILSANGLTMTVSQSGGGDMYRLTQGTSWSGNFAPGDGVLYNGTAFTATPGDLIIDFSAGIFGLGGGAQVMANFFGPFTGTISAYSDAGVTLLGSFPFAGTSAPSGDDSAVFAGILSDTPDIRRIVFSATGVGPFEPDFAINGLELRTSPGASVPDGGATLSLLGFALLGLGVLRRHLKA